MRLLLVALTRRVKTIEMSLEWPHFWQGSQSLYRGLPSIVFVLRDWMRCPLLPAQFAQASAMSFLLAVWKA